MAAFDKLDWDDLKVFVQAARAGNLSGAAKRLRVDHSTVSRRIAHLEATLGLPVFERQPTGLRLSGLGERVLRHAERVESAVIALQEEIAGEDPDLPGRVRLATMEGIASLYLARRLGAFQARNPTTTIELVTSPQTVYVNRREADLFLSFFRPTGPGLISEMVGRFRLNVYGGAAYFDRHGRPSEPAELSRHAYVSYIEDLIQVDAVRWLDDIVRGPRIVFHSNSMIAQLNAAAGGLGLVVLPEFATEGRGDLLPVLPERVSTSRELWINVHNDLQFSARIRAVASFLKELFRADPKMQVDGGAPARPCAAPGRLAAPARSGPRPRSPRLVSRGGRAEPVSRDFPSISKSD